MVSTEILRDIGDFAYTLYEVSCRLLILVALKIIKPPGHSRRAVDKVH